MAPSARHSRREPSQMSEQISEGNDASQLRRQEDVEDDSDEQRPRRTGTKVKKEKRSTRKKPDTIEEDEPALPANSGPQEEFDRNNYTDQPLSQTEATKIGGFGTDWVTSKKGFNPDGAEMVKSLAGNMAEYVQNRESKKEMGELDSIMKSLVDYDQIFQFHEQALSDIAQKVKRGEKITDLVGSYEAGVLEKKKAYEAKTSRQKYSKMDDYIEFQSGIFEVNHPGEAMPPITEFIPREDGDESDDDDVEVGGVTQDYKCPISLTPLVDPVTSQLCHHSFSKSNIREYLQGRTRQCPFTGCGRNISMADLKENKSLARRQREALRRQEMRPQNDSDEDDVIE